MCCKNRCAYGSSPLPSLDKKRSDVPGSLKNKRTGQGSHVKRFALPISDQRENRAASPRKLCQDTSSTSGPNARGSPSLRTLTERGHHQTLQTAGRVYGKEMPIAGSNVGTNGLSRPSQYLDLLASEASAHTPCSLFGALDALLLATKHSATQHDALPTNLHGTAPPTQRPPYQSQ